ncbi:hypothetical protein BQ8794_240299 [Mesorhizobium prunaredense]|uniref:Uncharacterized protein n=1 Tax=Mesorhizobium prunaredense TaxID=1631249 RepID=A0A1R3V8E8_9HYPH|nr:hypothetical protein BQ8794_240299 [Mesorhizobium prunaredense]
MIVEFLRHRMLLICCSPADDCSTLVLVNVPSVNVPLCANLSLRTLRMSEFLPEMD